MAYRGIDTVVKSERQLTFSESVLYGFNVFCIIGSIAFIATIILI